jgi:hypothetical protein
MAFRVETLVLFSAYIRQAETEPMEHPESELLKSLSKYSLLNPLPGLGLILFKGQGTSIFNAGDKYL